jgi:hypothetical protein
MVHTGDVWFKPVLNWYRYRSNKLNTLPLNMSNLSPLGGFASKIRFYDRRSFQDRRGCGELTWFGILHANSTTVRV